MPAICLRYNLICLKYIRYKDEIAWDKPHKCLKCARDFPEISLRSELCMRYVLNMPDLPQIYLRYALDNAEICMRYA